jgi:hypothetical protein
MSGHLCLLMAWIVSTPSMLEETATTHTTPTPSLKDPSRTPSIEGEKRKQYIFSTEPIQNEPSRLY